MCKAKSLLKAIGLRSGMGTHSLPEGVGGKDPIINAATAHGSADIALRHKSQRTRDGSPARDQSRIWQVAGVVTHGTRNRFRWHRYLTEKFAQASAKDRRLQGFLNIGISGYSQNAVSGESVISKRDMHKWIARWRLDMHRSMLRLIGLAPPPIIYHYTSMQSLLSKSRRAEFAQLAFSI